jgi:predicted flap endonuclease-1-like 5' DNA nuclease
LAPVIDVVDLPPIQLERAVRDLTSASRTLLVDAGLSVAVDEEVPLLVVYAAVRTLTELASRQRLIGYRVALYLRDDLSKRLGIQDVDKRVVADIWRHRTHVQFVPMQAAVGHAIVLEEVQQQLKAFINDWQEANPEKRINRELRGADFKLPSLPGIGPVFLRRLHDSGIRRLEELATLSDEEIDVLAPLFSPKPDAIGLGKSKLEQLRDSAREILTL